MNILKKTFVLFFIIIFFSGAVWAQTEATDFHQEPRPDVLPPDVQAAIDEAERRYMAGTGTTADTENDSETTESGSAKVPENAPPAD